MYRGLIFGWQRRTRGGVHGAGGRGRGDGDRPVHGVDGDGRVEHVGDADSADRGNVGGAPALPAGRGELRHPQPRLALPRDGGDASRRRHRWAFGSRVQHEHCTQSDPGKLTLYINGTRSQDVTFPSTQSWGGTYGKVTVNVTVPEGATIKLQNDPGDAGTNLDYIQVQ